MLLMLIVGVAGFTVCVIPLEVALLHAIVDEVYPGKDAVIVWEPPARPEVVNCASIGADPVQYAVPILVDPS